MCRPWASISDATLPNPFPVATRAKSLMRFDGRHHWGWRANSAFAKSISSHHRFKRRDRHRVIPNDLIGLSRLMMFQPPHDLVPPASQTAPARRGSIPRLLASHFDSGATRG
jgi:hypothetical protein